MKEKVQSRQIIVLGMHRSGTSALNGALSGMGVYVGDPDDLTKPLAENPKGFFERRDARRICDAMLHDEGADWWKVSGFDSDSNQLPLADRHREAIIDLLNELDSHGHWTLKEPRLCLLLPLFRPWLQKPLVVVVLRHPLEVAKSLRQRNGFPVRVGLALWEVYTLAALRSARHETHHLVRHSDLVSSPHMVIERLVDWLEDNGVSGLDIAGGMEMIDPSLRHQRHSRMEEAWLPSSVSALWGKLSGGEFYGDLPAVAAETIWTLKEFEVDHGRELAARAQSKALSKEFQSVRADVDGLKQELGTARSEIESWRSQAQEAEAELGEARKALSDFRSVADGAKKQAEKVRARYERALKDSKRHVDELRERLDQSREEAGALSARLRMQDAALGGICASLGGKGRGGDAGRINWFDRVTVSVVLVLENGNAKSIVACLDTMKRQTWPRWELVVVHDPASFEGDRDLEGLTDPRVRLVASSSHARINLRNRGLSACAGELVAYWGADSDWQPSHLQRAVSAFQHRPEGALYSSVMDSAESNAADDLTALVHRKALTDCFGAWATASGDEADGAFIPGLQVLPALGDGGRTFALADRPEYSVGIDEAVSPRFRQVRLIGPERAGQAALDDWLQAFGPNVDVAVTRWDALQDCSAPDKQAGDGCESDRVHSTVSWEAFQSGLAEELAQQDAEWVIALGNSPVAQLQALLSHFHTGCAVTIVSTPERDESDPERDSLQEQLRKLVSSCIEDLGESDLAVCPSLMILGQCWLSVDSSALRGRLAYLDRVLLPAERPHRAVERLANAFSRWRTAGPGNAGVAAEG
ncbi:glycosyltransferase [Wenzhouxiangella sp. EGI_FJ10305]|uniref:glycosyltransferase n=1 Tax=Wenzhouxiangella sp. EGI_FJ10305 TaxID=3243768 RepID=UPI0035D5BAA9